MPKPANSFKTFCGWAHEKELKKLFLPFFSVPNCFFFSHLENSFLGNRTFKWTLKLWKETCILMFCQSKLFLWNTRYNVKQTMIDRLKVSPNFFLSSSVNFDQFFFRWNSIFIISIHLYMIIFFFKKCQFHSTFFITHFWPRAYNAKAVLQIGLLLLLLLLSSFDTFV